MRKYKTPRYRSGTRLGSGGKELISHKQATTFLKKLRGSDGCNFREDEHRIPVWTCTDNHAATERILEKMGFSGNAIEMIIARCKALGGHCDCEIVFNITVEDLSK